MIIRVTGLAYALDFLFKINSMKNILRLWQVAALVLFGLSSMAQSGIGFKAGANYAGLTGYEGDRRISFHAGVFLQVPMKKNISIQPELLYSSEGQHYTVTDEEGSESDQKTITLDYISFPVLLNIAASPKFHIATGPQLSFLVAAHSLGFGTDHENVRRSFGETAFAWGVGLSYAITSSVNIYGRYNLGLTDTRKGDTDSQKSQVAQLGFAFRPGKSRKAETSR